MPVVKEDLTERVEVLETEIDKLEGLIGSLVKKVNALTAKPKKDKKPKA